MMSNTSLGLTNSKHLHPQLPFNDDSSHFNTNGSLIVSKAKEVKKVLDKIEVESLSELKLEQKMKVILDKFFTDIMQLSPDLGHILNKLKTNSDRLNKEVQELRKECNELKSVNENLKEAMKELGKKASNTETLNQDLKFSNETLKKQSEELRSKFLGLKIKLAQIIETGINDKISEEMEELFNENQYSRQLVCTLKNSLRKMKLREEFLINTMKKNKVYNEELVRRLQELQPTSIEIGKNKTKVPILDFSMMEVSMSSEEHGSTKKNQVHMLEGYYKPQAVSL